jgi:sulfite exporter TauE/SafE
MNWWQRVRGRWRMEDELDAELRFHFDRLVADYVVGVAVGSIGAKAWDPQVAAGVLAAVSLVVIAVVVGVSAWPAARAGRIDPLGMLRDQ